VPATVPQPAEEKTVRISDRRFALFLMTPAALFLAVFVAFPLFRLVADSFFKISPIAGGPRDFVGLDNYFRAFASEAFMGAGWRTLAYTLLVVTLEFALGLGGPCSCTR
jgi:multiple sugar transport system permease protein